MPDDYTYDNAVTKCKSTGRRLCTDAEICQGGSPVYGVKVGEDKWTPFAGAHNSWIQIGMFCFVLKQPGVYSALYYPKR